MKLALFNSFLKQISQSFNNRSLIPLARSRGIRKPRRELRRLLWGERLEQRWLMAVGDLRIVTYNVLGYDGTPSTDIGTVLKAIGDEVYQGRSRPVDVVAIQEVMSQATTTASIVSQLNAIYGAGTYARGNLNGSATSANQTVGLIYNTQTVSLIAEVGVGTPSVTGMARQPIRYQLRPIGVPTGNDFYLYNSHYKATGQGTETADENRRTVESQVIRQNADALGQGALIIYAGDQNTKKSSEGSFQTLIGAGNGQAIDPANKIGDWSGNTTYRDIFTQAPAVNPPSGYVGGGLNDRFDFQLLTSEWTDGLGMEYVASSYRTFANNGTVALNGNINSASNTALPGLPNRTAILNLLTTTSDHLPVVVDYEYRTSTPALDLTIAASSISENGGTTTGRVIRNGPTTSALQVALTSNDTTEATVPATVTIPAGSTSVTFTITAVNDSVADGDQNVTITASSSGFTNDSAQLTVTDDEVPTLTLTLDVSSIPEFGGQAIGTVRRNTPTGTSLTVNLGSSVTSAATVPTSVVIPAGSDTGTFIITAVDDTIADGDQLTIISISAPDFVGATKSLTVTDDETARLTLLLTETEISEVAGETFGTLWRNTPTTFALTVFLSSSDTTSATVPSSVTIPAGSASVTFTINAVNDFVADGDSQVTITATAGTMQPVTAQLTVIDDEEPELTVNFNVSFISENGGMAIGQVSRNTPTTSSLLVNLVSSMPSLLSVPATVTIPAGAVSATFTATAIDNSIATGHQEVSVTASSSGLLPSTQVLTVDDDESPSLGLTIDAVFVSEKGGTATATVRRNTPTTSDLTVAITNSHPSDLSVPATVVIPAGETAATFTILSIDNEIAQGNRTATLKATASGLSESVAELLISDDDAPSLKLELDHQTIDEAGGFVTATLTRNTPTTNALEVVVQHAPINMLQYASTIVIPAGSSSTTFQITARQNGNATGDVSVTLFTNVPGFPTGMATLLVIDDDTPSLDLTFESAAIGEGKTTVATLVRNTSTQADMTILLSSSDTTLVTVPASVTIPAGQSSATFTVTAGSDLLAYGNLLALIRASANGIPDVEKSILVLDDDIASLTLELDATASENSGSLIARVVRNTPLHVPLTVNLSSSDTSEATVPASITIPVNQIDAFFSITLLEDGSVDGPQDVQIGATAVGHAAAIRTLKVLDSDAWSWTNPKNPFDTDDDNTVSPLDILVLINELNTAGPRSLNTPPATKPSVYFDADRDKSLSPLDVLVIINFINQSRSGEGEAESKSDDPISNSDFSAVDEVFVDWHSPYFSTRRKRR